MTNKTLDTHDLQQNITIFLKLAERSARELFDSVRGLDSLEVGASNLQHIERSNIYEQHKEKEFEISGLVGPSESIKLKNLVMSLPLERISIKAINDLYLSPSERLRESNGKFYFQSKTVDSKDPNLVVENVTELNVSSLKDALIQIYTEKSKSRYPETRSLFNRMISHGGGLAKELVDVTIYNFIYFLNKPEIDSALNRVLEKKRISVEIEKDCTLDIDLYLKRIAGLIKADFEFRENTSIERRKTILKKYPFITKSISEQERTVINASPDELSSLKNTLVYQMMMTSLKYTEMDEFRVNLIHNMNIRESYIELIDKALSQIDYSRMSESLGEIRNLSRENRRSAGGFEILTA